MAVQQTGNQRNQARPQQGGTSVIQSPTAEPRNYKQAPVTTGELSGLMEQYKKQIEMAVPRHITPERMMRVALTAFSRTPKLAECNPFTILGSIVQASIMGLEPDGISGQAYLIPYNNWKIKQYECQMQPGYLGLVKLARNTGQYSMIDAQAVHEGDDFDFEKGSDPWWRHKWDKRATPETRGPIIGYWAGYSLVQGKPMFEYWTVAEIEAHRDRYSEGAFKKEFINGKYQHATDKDGNRILQGPWKDSPDWMYKKTPLKQVLKLGPKSYELSSALSMDERIEAGKQAPFTIEVPSAFLPIPVPDSEEPGEQPEAENAKPEIKMPEMTDERQGVLVG